METILQQWYHWLSEGLKKGLEATAWPMTPPAPYSAFHLLFAAVGITAAVFLAWRLRRLSRNRLNVILFIVGALLTASEGYKQLFLYEIVNHGHYDWWYFPFQLCSLPMYLCLILPFAGRFNQLLCTFMGSYNLMGAFMVFLDPSDLMHPYWTLTIHGFLWHILVIFAGFVLAFSGMAVTGSANRDKRYFAGATGLFLCFCVIATGINVAVHPFGFADMFYISPYVPNGQLVFSELSAIYGILPGNLLYIGAAILAAGITFAGCRRLAALGMNR